MHRQQPSHEPPAGLVVRDLVAGFAFESCNNLKYVYLGTGLKIVQSAIFSNCDALLECEIPESAEQLSSVAVNCKSLESVTIPDSVKNVGAIGKESSKFGAKKSELLKNLKLRI